MEKEKYASGTKGVWIGVHILCMVILAISLCAGITLLSVAEGELGAIMNGVPYEKSDGLRSSLQADGDFLQYIEDKELFESKGAYDGEKYLDIMAFTYSSYQREAGSKPLEYKLNQINNWANSDEFENRGYYEYEPSYMYDEEGRISLSEKGEIVIPDGPVFREQFAPNGYASLAEYCAENKVSVEAAYLALYSTLSSWDSRISNYNYWTDNMTATGTNLRYKAVKNGQVVATNIPAGEKCKRSVEVVENARGYEISRYLNADYPVADTYAQRAEYYTQYLSMAKLILAGIILGFIGALASLIYLTRASGHIPGKEGIALSWIDKPKTEIALVFWFCIGTLVVLALTGSVSVYFYEDAFGLVLLGISAAGGSALALTGYLSMVRRIKKRTLASNSFCHQLKHGLKTIIRGTKVSYKLIIAFAIYLVVMLLCIVMGGFGFLLAVLFNIFVGVLLTRDALSRQKIMDGLQRIADGELEHKIDVAEINSLNLDMADAVNKVGGGLEAAVDKSIRNERMKSDLITNVSHDIKTPLTSIINYVDLLKREDIPNEKAKGYIDILDQKSQRLKQLTEDLVEASKISSGNVTLELNRMDFNEILQQAVGEFEERFKSRSLHVVVNRPETPVVIEADGRRIWRIIENLFQNVIKYAMPGTRVYVELTENKRDMTLAVKNISENPLNITADELTERFIRGDVSRSTEGSGLGLSIAKSLTALQKGDFEIYLDGDLFKVTVTFGLID